MARCRPTSCPNDSVKALNRITRYTCKYKILKNTVNVSERFCIKYYTVKSG